MSNSIRNKLLAHEVDLLAEAVELAEHGWQIFPLSGKVPAIPGAHFRFISIQFGPCIEGIEYHPNPRWGCKGECGRLGHGLYDATDDVHTVTEWWSGAYRGCNIGARVPEAMLVIDIDPRHGGDQSWADLEERYGSFPDSMMVLSGRGDGGHHRFVRRPLGRLTSARLGPGIDLKTSTGYTVMPPSIHPDTGDRYVLVDGEIPAPAGWFIPLVTAPPALRSHEYRSGGGPADAFESSKTWEDVLAPHGWNCLDPDPDADGARWLHPDATSSCSATIRHGCLFVYSTNTPFEVTESGRPNGYTKFRAHAVLNHGGDLSAAARALRGGCDADRRK
ncbi:bifunctional DNA primase/polymerase [Mycobacterium colombiense]|uniref:bifunctional DNA primase/polymerase n=1 Tax=Mycobacterium colombiense TaxID=339268 RepID=UPI0009E3B8C2|nr:bifunctional DNA primase/polymerase [Mycobacterium colombiense]